MDVCLSVKDKFEIISEIHGIDSEKDRDEIINHYAKKNGVDKDTIECVEVSFTIEGKYW